MWSSEGFFGSVGNFMQKSVSRVQCRVRIQKKMLGQVFTLTFELKIEVFFFFFFFDKKLIGFG